MPLRINNLKILSSAVITVARRYARCEFRTSLWGAHLGKRIADLPGWDSWRELNTISVNLLLLQQCLSLVVAAITENPEELGITGGNA